LELGWEKTKKKQKQKLWFEARETIMAPKFSNDFIQTLKFLFQQQRHFVESFFWVHEY